MPIKGKVNRSQGQHVSGSVAAESDQTFEMTPDGLDPRDMFEGLVLGCGSCQNTEFAVLTKASHFVLGCDKCGWESKLRSPAEVEEKYINSTPRCNYCQHDHWIFQRDGQSLIMGCSRCHQGVSLPFETLISH